MAAAAAAQSQAAAPRTQRAAAHQQHPINKHTARVQGQGSALPRSSPSLCPGRSTQPALLSSPPPQGLRGGGGVTPSPQRGRGAAPLTPLAAAAAVLPHGASPVWYRCCCGTAASSTTAALAPNSHTRPPQPAVITSLTGLPLTPPGPCPPDSRASNGRGPRPSWMASSTASTSSRVPLYSPSTHSAQLT
jgi:hypothetical protein